MCKASCNNYRETANCKQPQQKPSRTPTHRKGKRNKKQTIVEVGGKEKQHTRVNDGVGKHSPEHHSVEVQRFLRGHVELRILEHGLFVERSIEYSDGKRLHRGEKLHRNNA